MVAACLLAACVAELPHESSTDDNVETHNRLGANRLGANRLGANLLAAGALATDRIAGDTLSLDSASALALLETADGRELLTYIVSCALPEGTTLVDTRPDLPPEINTEYFGTLGLAPQWLDKPLDGKGKGWVSACLFSRVNANDHAVAISMRGPHPQLTSSPEEEAAYSLQEGAFYGDYFTPIDVPIKVFACRGRDEAVLETGGLVDRDCAEPSTTTGWLSACDLPDDNYDFVYTGDCFDDATVRGRDGACTKDDAGNYSGCTGLSKKGGPYHEVITTYVEPTLAAP